jgi:hypothetical protein
MPLIGGSPISTDQLENQCRMDVPRAQPPPQHLRRLLAARRQRPLVIFELRILPARFGVTQEE